MKYLDRVQKNIVGFKPDMHWRIILSVSFVVLVAGFAYDIYLYVYARQQIGNAVDVLNVPEKRATSTVNLNMEELFEVFKSREVVYDGIMKTLTTNRVAPLITATTTATTTKTGLVATSSKQ